MKSIYLFLFSFFITTAFAQVPSNDACTNAQAIALPQSGIICINSSNLNATSDNSTNTCDIGSAGNEVWFTYVATGANNVITVTPNGTGPATSMVVTLITSGCTSGVYDICNSATGSASVASTLGLAPGTQVLISVETNGTDGDFQLCISSTPPDASPGNTCGQSSLVCDRSSIDFPDLTGFTASGTSPSCFSGLFGPIPVRKDVWVKFTVGTSGTFEFTGTALGASTEFDWAVFDITLGCLGSEVACNYDFSGATTNFGLSSTITGTDISPSINVIAGHTYAILVDNYTQNNTGFSIDWGGTFQMGTSALFSVTPQSSCTTPVTVNITNSSVGATTYTWSYGDGSSSNSANPATHTYTASGDYLMSLVVTGGGCTSVYSQRINLNTGPVITMNPTSATVCPTGVANLNAAIALGTPYNDHNFTNNPNAAITNNSAAGITNTITSTGILNTTLTTGMLQSICFTINHTKHSDIGNASAGDVTINVNGVTYSFTPLPLPAVSGTATYCFPQSVLNAIMAAGGNSNTSWTIKIADTRGGGGGSGSLVSWTVVLRDPNSVVSYVWSPTATMTNSNTLSPTVSPTIITAYSLTATDFFGCSTVKTVSVTVNPTPITNAITTGTLTCSTLTVALSTSLTGVSYTWSAPAGGSVSSANSQTTSASGAIGNYTLFVSSASGCTYSTTTSVTQNTTVPLTTASTTGTLTCAAMTVTLNSTLTGMNYTWTAPAGGTVASANTQSTTASGASGIYSLTIVNPTNGCTYSTTTSVTQNTTVPITTASTTGSLTCTATTVTLNSTLVGMNYTWTAPAGGTVTSVNSQSTAASSASGIYSLTIKNPANGCISTATASVTQNTIAPTGLSAGTNKTLTCSPPNVTLNGSVTTPTNATASWAGPNVCGILSNFNTSACSAGIYTLTAANPANGCKSTSTVQVFPSPGAPSVSVNPVTNSITCTNTLVTISLSTTVTPVTYSWSGLGIVGSTTLSSVSVSQAGTFSYTVTNSAACSTTGTKTVSQNTTVPTTTVSITGTLTCNTTTVSLNSTLAGMNYTWTAPAGGIVTSANTQSTAASGIGGTYSLTVMNPINGCTYSTTKSVVQNTTAPTTTATTTGTLTCATTTVSLNSTLAGMNYTWSPPAGGSVTSTNTQSTIASGASGIYSLTIKNPANGCIYSTTTSVTQNTVAPTGVNAGINQTLTCSSPSVTLNGSVATPTNATVNWIGSNVCGSVSNFTTSACSAGIYTLTATNPINACVSTSTVEIFPSTGAPTVSVNPVTNSITCTTTLVTISLSTSVTPVTYNWSGLGIVGSTTLSSIDVSQGGTFSYTVTSSSGCSSLGTQTVAQNTAVPTSTASVNGSVTCIPTATVTLNSTLAGMNYTWTAPAGGNVASANTQSTSATGVSGAYSLTIVNPANGCTYSTTATVTQNTTVPTGVNAGSNQTLTCASPSVALSGSIATPTNAAALWTGANVCGVATNSITSVCGAGIYTLTATNPINGCTATSTVQVFPSAGAPAVIINPVTNTITCTNTLVTVSISSTVSPASYTWSGTGIVSGNGTGTITVNQGGTFNFTLTNTTNSCSTSNNQVVIQNTTIPTNTATTTGVLTCSVTTVVLNSTLSGMNYTWTAPTGGSVISANTQSTSASGISGTYSLTVNDPTNGCAYTATTSVTQNTTAPITTASTSGTLTCNTTTATLNSTLAGMNYTWTAPTGGSVANTNAQSTTASGISGTYSLTVNDPINGCSYSTTTSVTQNTTVPTTTASTTGTLTCNTTTVTLNSTLTGMNYLWTAPAGGSVTATNTQSTVASDASGTYSLTITDPNNGCIFTTTTNVTQNTAAPIITISNTQTLTCLITTLTLNATGGGTYNWSGAGITSGGTTSSPAVNLPGIYTVTVTASNGCDSIASTTVIKNAPTPTITIASTPTLTCLSPTTTLHATGGGTYLWSGPGITNGIATANPDINLSGVYSLTVTDSNGCSSATTTAVSQNMTMSGLIISPDVIIDPGTQTTLSIMGGSSTYTWSPSLGLSCTTCSNPIASPEETTQYCVTSKEGVCSNSACVTVKVEINCENGSNYTTPNAFSPNGDGNNDQYCLQGWKGCISNFYIAIYNRWGNKVFESTQEDFCWDGTYLGKILDPAVFVFYIKAELVQGGKIDRKGNITLIK